MKAVENIHKLTTIGYSKWEYAFSHCLRCRREMDSTAIMHWDCWNACSTGEQEEAKQLLRLADYETDFTRTTTYTWPEKVDAFTNMLRGKYVQI